MIEFRLVSDSGRIAQVSDLDRSDSQSALFFPTQDAEDYSDVVRHVASECNALYHMRKLTRLVQEKTSLVSCIVKEDSQPIDSPKE